MSNEPSGAIDEPFDESERDARSILEEAIGEYEGEVKGGDIVLDLVKRRPLFVRRRVANTAVEYFDEHDFDLTTYKAHPFLPITPDDPIFECVFLPTDFDQIPTSTSDRQTYDYPRGRLVRIPVEYLYGSETRPQTDQKTALVAACLRVASDAGDLAPVERTARTVFGDDVVDDAAERADLVPDELGDFDDGGNA